MTDKSMLRAAILLCAFCGAGAALAHHSTAAEFDSAKPVTFTGTVQKVMWMNPHIYTLIEVKQPDGTAFVYHVEGGPPNSLFRQGWRKDTLRVGTLVTVNGWRAKNPDSPNVGQAVISSADGKKLFSGEGPTKAAE
jgi:Family of unknown function (DUF6152)